MHNINFCGRKFKRNGIWFTYERADFRFIDGKSTTVIYYKDDKGKEYWKTEKEFFDKVTKEELLLIHKTGWSQSKDTRKL